MNILNENSEYYKKNNSSKYISDEHSLTAKLAHILNSSDEILLENSEIFRGSSNELTEFEEVHSLPHSDSRSVPRLDIEERNRSSNAQTEYKSGESYTSIGTVVRHETPKIGQKKARLIKPAKTASTTPVKKIPKKKDLENKEFSVFLLKIAKKKPDFSAVIQKEKTEFEAVFRDKAKDLAKITEYSARETLTLNRERLKKKNKEKEKKREEIRVKFREEELERLRKSFTEFEKNCKFRLKNQIDYALRKYQTLKVLEDQKSLKEKLSARSEQKKTIKENIRNYYDHKIQICKEKITEKKIDKAIRKFELKQVSSDQEKTRKKERSGLYEYQKKMIQLKAENARLEMEIEEESACCKIVKLYKNSVKPFKSSNL